MEGFSILIFQLIVLIFSVMVHEVSHGVTAYKLGDDTAKVMGRLNLNPFKHLDLFGSFLLPLFLIILRSPILFGWAKPVPYNPDKLKNPRMGAALIGAAGPLSNIAMAIIFGFFIRLIGLTLDSSQSAMILPLLTLFNIIVFINILLGVFNLVPIPPLDGSKIFFAILPIILPRKYFEVQKFLEAYGMMLLLFFLFFGFGLIVPIIKWVYTLIVGQWAIVI